MDVLRGDKGKDNFLFTGDIKSGYDEISDYTVKDDTIWLDNDFFTTLKEGDLSKNAFESDKSGKAEDGKDRIIFETDTGKLFYDQDGKGGNAAVWFAELSPGLKLTHKEFDVVDGWDIGG